MCVFVLRTLLLPSRWGRTREGSSECKTDQVDFTYWVSFLPSNLIEDISHDLEALSANI